MRVIALKRLQAFWADRPDAEQPLKAWYRVAAVSAWRSPADLQAQFPYVSLLKDNRVVFNIGGNKYRLVAWVNYAYATVYIRFIGTHADYDRIDAQRI